MARRLDSVLSHVEGPKFFISDLCSLADTYLEPEQVKEIYRAYLFGAEAHDGQKRASGEPYIYHPIEVARLLVEMRLDYQSVVAALLHDVIEDTPTAKEHLAAEFGEGVARLVDGVSKLTQIKFPSKAEAQAENFRKMLLAMADDIRVILVKLADRLHNMRTLGALRPEKRRLIARETLDIYAPVANRLGINNIRLELEDLGFAALYPIRHRVLANEVRKARGHRKELVQTIETAIKQRLSQESMSGQVLGREKHLYSLYKKMRDKRLSFTDVLDVYAFRIIVENVDHCYRVLGAIHNLFKPVPGKFKDYIAIPKANGYQSLHTVLFGPHGVPIEVQIRTQEMHDVAEAGIAAHWVYKDDDNQTNVTQRRAREWLRELLEMQKNAGNSLEFLENVKIDLFPDEVYLFTPGGDIMELPRGTTAVDFAYAVHSDVGNTCVAAKIDRRYAPLSTVLGSGQTVEIVTAPWGRPNPNWLDFVVTGKARANIRGFLKNLQHGEAEVLGRRMLNNALAGEGTLLNEVPKERIQTILKEFNLGTEAELLSEVGLGNRVAAVVARRLTDDHQSETNTANEPTTLTIRGTEGMVVSYARCCHPIPGDPILGFMSSGRGVVIHTQSCNNIAEHLDRPEKWFDVEWGDDIEGEFPVEVRVEAANQRGVLATIAAAISDEGANITDVEINDRDGLYSDMIFALEVLDRQHLARVIRRIRNDSSVNRIARKHK